MPTRKTPTRTRSARGKLTATSIARLLPSPPGRGGGMGEKGQNWGRKPARAVWCLLAAKKKKKKLQPPFPLAVSWRVGFALRPGFMFLRPPSPPPLFLPLYHHFLPVACNGTGVVVVAMLMMVTAGLVCLHPSANIPTAPFAVPHTFDLKARPPPLPLAPTTDQNRRSSPLPLCSRGRPC